MRHIRRLTSLLMLLVILVTGAAAHCDDSHFSGEAAAISCSSGDGGHSGHGNALPCSDPDGCSCCVDCPCHAPLAMRLQLPPFTPLIAVLEHADISAAIPEVYLPKFIPPQNS